MPRPKRYRRILAYPDFWNFIPERSEAAELTLLTLDEYETIRLIDYEKLTHEACAEIMCVSRATVTGIYENARFKLADAMVNGKAIRITGGAYRIDDIPASAELNEKDENVVRIAVAYEEEMVGQHFGKTEQFKIFDVENGEIKASQIIDTNGTGHGALAGFLRAAEVETLICGGIGIGAGNAVEEVGIRLLPGVSGAVDDVIKEYLTGRLSYDPETACHYHDHPHGGGEGCRHGDGCQDHTCSTAAD